MIFNPWFVSVLILLGIWLVVFLGIPRLRKEMLLAGLFTFPLGLTEPLFVPEYWNPPSLFNLANIIGFDLESLIFSFAIGGLAAIAYEIFVKVKHKKFNGPKLSFRGNLFHLISLFSPVIIFIFLYFLTDLNPIYWAIISMFFGGIFGIFCRRDLLKSSIIGAFIFSIFYFLFFLIFNLIYPRFIQQVWNFSTISGILIFGVPLEEILFAFSLGFFWSGLYEHILGYRLKKIKGGKK